MKILALQLKRIGDLVLTTAALRVLRQRMRGLRWARDAHLALGVMEGNVSLLPAIEGIDSAVVFGRGRGFAPWQQILAGGWDMVFDFTGTDRSALATALSRAKHRKTFSWVRKARIRALAYNEFVDSAVRERHTADHYLDLLKGPAGDTEDDSLPMLKLPDTAREQASALLRAAGVAGDFALLHPGTAREEKYWRADRWAQVIDHLQARHGLRCVLSGGSDPFEQAHVAVIQSATKQAPIDLAGQSDVLGLAALAEQARVVVSCDTSIVHLASAFRTPQVVLYGPINPFHWHPRHERAVVLSAAQPDAPLTQFDPRMKGAPMDRISTGLVIDAIAQLIPTL